MSRFVLAIDQGTTSSRAILFDDKLQICAVAQQEFAQHFPRPGWVEHDPEDIWRTTIETCRAAIQSADIQADQIVSIGITNQRETTVVWERETGNAIHNAIVWQDRRTAEACAALKLAGHEESVSAKTGLLLDPYFSATKIAWILDNVPGARDAANASRLAFGTIDSFLLWRLTGGTAHATDATNASRTMLYDIHEGRWSDELCALFNVPRGMLPDVNDCIADFGSVDPDILGAPIPISGMAGDQQAATVGQACFEPGMVKSTYGTGCFALMNTGSAATRSSNRLLTTIAYQFEGKPTYALEGSIFIAGAAVQWLRDGLGLVSEASEMDDLAAKADLDQQVYFVPAFVGLGAPHWDADCRGALFGLTRGTGRAEIARATLESVCFQTRDLLEAMAKDAGGMEDFVLRVDGGMVASVWTMQRLADILDAKIDRPTVLETTALGAAYMAGYRADIYPDPDGFAASWARERQFEPTMDASERDRLYAGWRDAVGRTLTASSSAVN